MKELIRLALSHLPIKCDKDNCSDCERFHAMLEAAKNV